MPGLLTKAPDSEDITNDPPDAQAAEPFLTALRL